MRRYFYISDDLDDLDAMETELEADGLFTSQIHVLSTNDAGVEQHEHLQEVHAFLKKDVLNSGLKGAVYGSVAALAVAGLAYLFGLHTVVGWVPFIFLSIILLGFITWEAGLYGIQEPNSHFKQFQKALDEGKHIFFVDADPEQAAILKRVHKSHPGVSYAGKGPGAPRWIVVGQQKWREFVHWAP